MHLLPRVVIRPAVTSPVGKTASSSGQRSRAGRRLLALGLAGAACCLAVTGCAQFNKALGQSTVQVFFTDTTTPAQIVKIMNACNNVNPHVKAVQNPAGAPPEDVQAIYNTTGASNAEIAELEECLSKYPQVTGVNPEDSSDDS